MVIQNYGVRIFNATDNTILLNYTSGGTKPQTVVFSRCGKFIGIGYQGNNIQILNSIPSFTVNRTLN
jgi:hypothetical protein